MSSSLTTGTKYRLLTIVGGCGIVSIGDTRGWWNGRHTTLRSWAFGHLGVQVPRRVPCPRGVIGRRACLRSTSFGVQVRVLSGVPCGSDETVDMQSREGCVLRDVGVRIPPSVPCRRDAIWQTWDSQKVSPVSSSLTAGTSSRSDGDHAHSRHDR